MKPPRVPTRSSIVRKKTENKNVSEKKISPLNCREREKKFAEQRETQNVFGRIARSDELDVVRVDAGTSKRFDKASGRVFRSKRELKPFRFHSNAVKRGLFAPKNRKSRIPDLTRRRF